MEFARIYVDGKYIIGQRLLDGIIIDIQKNNKWLIGRVVETEKDFKIIKETKTTTEALHIQTGYTVKIEKTGKSLKGGIILGVFNKNC